MKRILFAVAFLISTVAAQSELVVEQKIESPFMNGTSVTKIKGDKMRVDSPSPAGNVTMLLDSKNGEATTLIHAQKAAMKMNLNAIQEQMKKSGAGAATQIEKPKATGKTETIEGHEAELYEATVMGQTLRLWSAKNYPNAKNLKAAMDRVAKATSGGMFDPAQFEVPGVVVKSEMNSPQGKITTTLVAIRQEDVPASEFEVPAGYKTMETPGLQQ